mmetsp:Transcript_11220/g.24333  ORF Transcript_11220/g.24333 Transcript_11220/m.24333 type:complete len:1579 (-) Transcript_11220:120-4856(-)
MADAVVADAAAQEAARLQSARFLALSQRCHEQNWAQVHALAEQIVVHKRPQPPPPESDNKVEDKVDVSTVEEGESGDVVKEDDRSSNIAQLPDCAALDGTVAIPGQVMNSDSSIALGGMQEIATGESTSSHVDSVITRGEVTPNTVSQIQSKPALKKPTLVVPPPALLASSTPRMLSTCLGTASPLAWTCRYSAPSATVKLVLDLDLASVRRCLPQLGTPLHEIVGRPRPLRKFPLRRGRWSGVLGNEATGATRAAQTGCPTTAAALAATATKPRKKGKKNKKKRKVKTPRILAGLREWRRTVRTLIQADETLAKEDARNAALQADIDAAAAAIEGDIDVKSNPEEWRRTVHTMIKENVTNINRFKNPGNSCSNSTSSADSQRPAAAGEQQSSSASSAPTQRERSFSAVRATLAQDADGNTPLHFMVRGAASPAFGGGRFHSRHEVEDDYEDDSDDDADDDDEEEEVNTKDGSAMDVDSSAEETAAINTGSRARDLRHFHHWGAAGGSWDGVRWCMEAHLRRVERRMTRQRIWKEEEEIMRECEKMNQDYGKSGEEEEGESDGERGVARGVASVTIGSPPPMLRGAASGEQEVLDTDAFGFPIPKLPAKRKSLEFLEGKMKSIRTGSSSLSSGSFSRLMSEQKPKSRAGSRIKRTSKNSKYLDDDEHQDCCYDPLLGAVRDLVHACPEASGIPDHREYEETPLIVALKSSIYVVMEPSIVDNDFQLDGGNVAAGLAMLQPPPQDGPVGGGGGDGNGDGFGIFGGAGFGNGVGPVLNGMGLGMGGGGIGGGFGGGFPFPELGALMHNRPFNFFPDDEAMMAVLRGHGRRVTRPRRRRAAALRASALRASASSAGPPTNASMLTEGMEGDDNDDSSVSGSSSFPENDDETHDDPRHDAFAPSANEHILAPNGIDPPGVQLGLLPRRRPRYDYQTALEYRIFMLVRIMLDAYPRAACLMISDYTPLHSAVFHGRCPDTIRLLLHAEARFRSVNDAETPARPPSPSNVFNTPLPPPANPEPCPTLSGPAMLCTNTRGELPLHFACMRNECARSIRLLAEADPRAALVRDASGRTPLRWLWIRFVDGLLDRFGGRDTQREEDDARGGRIDGGADPFAFREQEGGRFTGNFPNPGQSVLGGMTTRGRDWLSMNDAFHGGGRSYHEGADGESSSNGMFVFDTEYIRRTRNIDRTVDFLRMRHVPSGFENIEYVAAEHAITVLLKLKYLQQRRNRQLEAYDTAQASARSGNDVRSGRLPPDVPMSTKEEFILYAFEKFTALIYAVLVASDAEERRTSVIRGDGTQMEILNDEATGSDVSDSHGDTPTRKKLWRSLPPQVDEAEKYYPKNKDFFLVHEACGASRASCPAAVAKICIRLHSDQLFVRDDLGRLPLHKVALRGIGWEPPGSDVDTAAQASLADETLTLLKEVLDGSHESASATYDDNRQLPLHCAVDSLVTSLVMGKRRRASLHAEARVALQKYRHTHVGIATECLSELLRANSSALQQRDGKTGLFPFMQAATPHVNDCAVVKYTSDLSRRPGFDVGVGFHSMEREIVDEDDLEAESDHVTIIYHLLREDPSVISGLC